MFGCVQEKEQFHRLAKLSKKYHDGKLPAIDWLDRLTFSEIERINQKENICFFPQEQCC